MADDIEFPCRVLFTRRCPELFGMHCDSFPYPCARFESDAEWPWTLELDGPLITEEK